MERFVHRQNLICLRKQLAETKEEAKRRQILRLLAEEEFKDDPLILLCHIFLRGDGPVIGALQHGHRGRLLTSAPISRRRMVAIEFGM